MSVNCKENWWEMRVGIKYVCQLQRELVGDGDRDQICLSNVKKMVGDGMWIKYVCQLQKELVGDRDEDILRTNSNFKSSRK